MKILVLAHEHFDEKHLEEVKEYMKNHGRPEIKVVKLSTELYVALEGCHRIRAAKELDMLPKLYELNYEEIKDVELTNGNLGLDFDMPEITIKDFVNSYWQNDRPQVSFNYEE